MQQQLRVSIFEHDQITTQYSLRSIEDWQKPFAKGGSQSQRSMEVFIKMRKLLSKKIRNKKCYSFQMLKQYFLYPESSVNSSTISVSPYDPLLFSDQKLHTLLKIMETKLIQSKIWALLNLKSKNREEKLTEAVQTLKVVERKRAFFQKQESFKAIMLVSKKSQKWNTLSKQSIIHMINSTDSLPEGSERQIKLDINLSKPTMAQTDQETRFSLQREVTDPYYRPYCSGCCHSCCCCFNSNDNLWSQIQYLKHLQQLVHQRQRRSAYG